jgi:hypothetical protein
MPPSNSSLPQELAISLSIVALSAKGEGLCH